MEQSSSWDEWTVRHQFDRICKLALKGEVIDYQRHMAYLQNLFCKRNNERVK